MYRRWWQRGWFGVAVMVGSALPALGAERLEAGISVVDITPIPGYRMSGYFHERVNTGTLDPLLAKAVVFKQGDVQAALVFCDLVGVSLEASTRARETASRHTGIPAEHIAVAATHSHTGPLYFGALRTQFHEMTVAATGHDRHELVDYTAELSGRVARAIIAAQADPRPVEARAGYGHEDRLAFNRRFHTKEGPVRFNPGALNPNIVRVAGPIDPQIGLISLSESGSNKPFGAIYAYALHLDTLGGTQYSADYPRFVQEDLRGAYGESFVSLFGAGTCGDINHVDVTVKERRKTAGIGTMLGESIRRAMPELKSIGEPVLAVRRGVIEAELQSYSAERIAAAKALMERVGDGKVPFLERVEAYKIMSLQLRGGTTMELEVQAFRLSDKVAIVTLPGEVFVELGLAIKKASPFETTIVIELANDAPGYIPTAKAFSEGSYETVNSRVVSGSGERMVEAATGLLKELAKAG
jgi:hypothetical protein